MPSPVILQVLPALHTGGVERGVLEIAEAIIHSGYQSLVASSGGTLVTRLEKQGSRHISLPLNTKNPLQMWRNAKRLEKIIKDYGVNIVHARSRAPAWSAYWACKRTGATFLTTFHSTYGYKTRLKRAYNRVMTKGVRVIAISDHIRRHIRTVYGVTHEEIDLIHRGVDLKVFNAEAVPQTRMIALARKWRLPEDKLIFMLPGRVTRSKGHGLVIEALSRLKDNSDWFCAFVGPFDESSNFYKFLRGQIAESALEDRIRFMGGCDDMPAAFSLADVVISASLQPEGFGRTIAEGCAMGRIVLASRHGGAEEIIEDEKTGYLFHPSNVENLEWTLRKIMALTIGERKRISAAARIRIVDNFSLEQMQHKTIEVYKKLLSA